MKNNVVEMVINQYLKNEDYEFLSDFEKKQNSTNKKLDKIRKTEKKVLEKISDDKKSLEDNPHKLRKYINSSESVVESVGSVITNLNELLKEYEKVKEKFNVIADKLDDSFASHNIEENMIILLNEIDSARELEKATEKDNEKNYIIINSFLNKTLDHKGYSAKVNKIDNLKNENDTVNNNIVNNNIDNTNDIDSNSDKDDNMVLKIYEKRVELPYTKKEIEDFMNAYPDEYKTEEDVISKEFIVHISLFNKHPVLSRFKEAYYLCRTKEMMSIFDSFNYAKSIMFRTDLNSYIIAAVKSKKQLEDYMECLENNKLDEFKYFRIVFKVNPLTV